jgi:uncharacterized RmlC-like cupin family protein
MDALDVLRRVGIFRDDRGTLTVAQSPDITFPIRRVFWVEMAPGAVRGGHYHENCKQAIVALRGWVQVKLNDQGYVLTDSGLIVIADPLKCIQYENLSATEFATVLVLCSEPYDEKDVFPCQKNE